jgi:CRP-like cAMP-binding protein
MSASVRQMLSTIPVFRFLDPRERDEVARVSTAQLYGKGRQIFAEGGPTDFFFAIVSGRVKVYKVTPTGGDVILSIFGPGDTLGAVVDTGDDGFVIRDRNALTELAEG